MGSEWKQISLEDIAANFPHAMSTGPFGSAISSKFFQDEGIPVIRGSNLSTNISEKMSDNGLVFLTPEKANQFKRSLVKPGDLIFTCWGTINQVGLITESLRYSEYIISNKQMKLTPDKQKVEPLFLYYLFSGPVKQAEIIQNGIGAAVPGFNLGQLKQHLIKLPPLKEQRRIIHILGSLDDKIELNRQMNATLDAIAQALFKSWFVDFDPVIDNALSAGNPIPQPLQARAEARKALGDQRQPLPEVIQKQFCDRFVFNDDLGWVPEGWKIVNLRDVTSTIIDHRGKTPKKMGGDWADSGYPAISAKNIKSGRIIKPESSRFVSEEMYKSWMKEELRAGDIALTSEAPLGETYYFATEQKYVLSQRLFGVRANKTQISGSYLYHWLGSARAQADMENRATGTTVTGIRQSELQNIVVLQPLLELVEAFTDFCDPTLIAIEQRELESKSLSETRDKLLPKLLSGQLRIPDAEKLVAEVI